MTSHASDLFPELAAADKPHRTSKPRSRWYLASNQLNLMYLLAAGLIPGPRGFGRKYYQDSLTVAPGWIPLFASTIPAAVLAQAVSEAGPLRVVVAELQLSALRGPIVAMDPTGQLRATDYPDGLGSSEAVIFIPAPLPSSWIRAVWFPNAQDKAATLDEVAAYGNVPFPAAIAKVKAGLFKPNKLQSWPPADAQPNGLLPPRDRELHRVWGIGATMTLLAAIANRGDTSVHACQLAFDAANIPAETLDNPILLALQRWISGQPAATDDGRQARMLLATLQAIIDDKQAADHQGHAADSRQAVLDFLQQQQVQLEDPRQADALDKLGRDLRGVLGFGADSGGELLQRHQKPYARALLLFFLRDDCAGLLGYRHPLLNEMDLIVAVMLFGAASGWRSLPNQLREAAGIDAVSLRMAAIAHASSQHNPLTTGADIELGPMPPYRPSIRELLTPGGKRGNNKQQQAALALARGMGWKDIVRTRVSLGKGDYQLHIDGSGAHILLDGEVKAVTTTVDTEPLLQRLGDAELSSKLEAAVRKLVE